MEFNEVLEQIQNPKFGRRQLSHLLLDQGFLAGVGNYLRSEILHSARISPSRKLNSLSEIEQNNLARSAIDVTQLAFDQRGVTVSKELYELLRENGLSRRQARHHVFTRDGFECHECKASIMHTRMSGRRLDYCPSCQT